MVNRLLANYLKQSLLPMNGPLITRLVGLVKVVETDRFTPGKVGRFPVSVDEVESCMTDSGKALPDLVPNQAERLTVYFEDNGAVPSGARWQSRIRLVAWGNADLFESATLSSDAVLTVLMNQFINALESTQASYDAPISALTCKVTAIPESGPNLFSRYTYQESVSQYLLPPYFAFGLDLQLTYVFKHGCLDLLTGLPVAAC